MQNNKNVMLASILSAVVLIGWTWFYERPRMEQQKIASQKVAESKKEQIKNPTLVKSDSAQVNKSSENPLNNPSENLNHESAFVKRSSALEASKNERVVIDSGELDGSINLKGARFDDLSLKNYRQTIDKKSEEVVLLAPNQTQERYFADFGWVSSDNKITLPNVDTVWKADSKKLTTEKPVTLTWQNEQNILFSIIVSMDENYMFSVSQKINNLSKDGINLTSFGRINRVLPAIEKPYFILHEGPTGAFDKILHEVTYEKMAEEKNMNFAAKTGWIGITDKYWLTAIIPDQKLPFNASFSHSLTNKNNVFNTEFIGNEFEVAAGQELQFDHHFFAGAKKVKLLDEYAEKYDIALFDRSIDFGWFYYLTKPFYFILKALNSVLGNFGLAILAMTVLIKAIMFPLANKSYGAIGKMKKLQPKIDKIRAEHKDNKMQMNKEIMEMYKKEKINPAAGCLPMIIQIPVFFSLYKVLFVTLDMRHAAFYGWIHDLSAQDTTSIFNLFGLLPFEVDGFMKIGILPILMGVTMMIQQKLSPAPSDPAQAKIMKFLPYILIFVFAKFPSGLLIYWTWSNILSIAQQYYINKKHA